MPRDVAALLRAVKLCREIGNAAPLRRFARRELMPGPLERAGSGAMAAPRGRLLFSPDLHRQNGSRRACPWWMDRCESTASQGLRIADGSVMPAITTGNTMAPCVMIGERAADLLRAQHASRHPIPQLTLEESMSTSIHPLFINGAWRPGSEGDFAEDINPATGEVFARIAQASAQDVEEALAAADRARHEWQKMLANEREALLHKAAEIIAAQADQIRDLLIEETGSVFMKAPWEVSYAVECLRVAAGCIRQPHGDTFPASAAGQIGMTIRQPLGVIAGIAPFNSPFLLSMKKIAFALAAGNTFILKPSDLAPLSGLKIAEIFAEAGLPAGVLNVIPGPAAMIGDKLVSDPRVKMITFTGSSKVGRHLAAEAGKYMKRVTLEMGGKNPLVVLKDADSGLRGGRRRVRHLLSPGPGLHGQLAHHRRGAVVRGFSGKIRRQSAHHQSRRSARSQHRHWPVDPPSLSAASSQAKSMTRSPRAPRCAAAAASRPLL